MAQRALERNGVELIVEQAPDDPGPSGPVKPTHAAETPDPVRAFPGRAHITRPDW